MENDTKSDNVTGHDEAGGYEAPKGSVTTRKITISGEVSLEYEARAEWILLRRNEKPVAEIFHVAYLQIDAAPEKRPITFVFNGGPGAASAYLHLGALGPRRIFFESDGKVPRPPVRLEDNGDTWLDFTDLVFVDPVGTGFSRTVKTDNDPKSGSRDADKTNHDTGKKTPDGENNEFYGLKRDLESLGEFMQKFLSKHHRWESPVCIAGESYGGFRAAKLARLLHEGYGIGLNGAILISPALEFTLLDPSDYDILPWIDVFPSMAAAAVYHGRSKSVDFSTESEKARIEAENFASRDLIRALAKGADFGSTERTRLYRRIAVFLGISVHVVETAEGRIKPTLFARELLRDQRKVCGMYDASITVTDPYPDRETYQGPDPTLYGIERAFLSGINAHLRSYLKVETEKDYHLLSMEVNRLWKVDLDRHALESQVGATDDLRYGMAINPHFFCNR